MCGNSSLLPLGSDDSECIALSSAEGGGGNSCKVSVAIAEVAKL